MTRRILMAIAGLLLAGAIWIGARGAGPVPPLAALLDPVRGAWSAASLGSFPDSGAAEVPGLSGPVEVRYDLRLVPHIFATTDEDAARAMGYVVARDRLFQLELQARAGGGTLTELVGAVALPADVETRELGLTRTAERNYALYRDSTAGRLAVAYAQGVNAFIDGLTVAEIPVEYKLLNRRPVRWDPINVFYMQGRMGYTLAYGGGEFERIAAEALVGRAASRALFPLTAPIQEPIQPTGSAEPRLDVQPIPAAGTMDSAAAAVISLLPRSPWANDPESRPSLASNNWAVSPQRSKSGYAMLAGDPHLELTLPSIWYEVHVSVPGVRDVYGAAIVGLPGLPIGFSRDIAWSMTNTGADVLDWYRETVDDAGAPSRYLLDEVWQDLEKREEIYLDPRGAVLRTDTIRFSHRGPLRRRGAEWLSMRWTVNDPSDAITAFLVAAQETTAGGFLDRFAERYRTPAQNAIAADRQGNIGIRSTGAYPIRPDDGDGLSIRDGTTRASDWQGYWPVQQYAQSLNPAQGYVASANQQPIDPASGARYQGPERDFDPWRALQINKLLRANDQVTLDDMRRYQTDPGSERVQYFLPYFTRAVSSGRTGGSVSPQLNSADSVLAAWDGRYTVGNSAAVLFEAAMTQLSRLTWDELIPPGDSVRVATPTASILWVLLHDSASAWWDVRGTPSVEDRDAVLRDALERAWVSTSTRHGNASAEGWRWGRVAPSRVSHLLRLNGFSRSIPVSGGRGTLNPSAGSGHGASWRMVVELGPRVRAMAIYPGGQSGNPASPKYGDRLRFWQNGDLELLNFPVAIDSMAVQQIQSRLTLRPAPLASGSGGS